MAGLSDIPEATPNGPVTFIGSRSGTPTTDRFEQIYAALAQLGFGINNTTA